MQVDKGTVIDLLDQQKPGLSSTSDVPKIETHPDSVPKPEAAPVEAKEEESATSVEPGDTPANDKPKAKGVQKRIDELTRQREDERRAREAAEQRAERALALLERAMKGETKSEKTDDPEPQEPDVSKYTDQNTYNADYRKYWDERTAWRARQEYQRLETEKQTRAQKEEQATKYRKALEAYESNAAKVREKFPDYDAVVRNPELAITPLMAHAIRQTDQGPEIAYHLGTNPQESARIASLPPESQLIELGVIAAKLKAAPPPPPVSAAPKPGKPLQTSVSAASIETGGEPDMESYAAKRREQLRAQHQPGRRLN